MSEEAKPEAPVYQVTATLGVQSAQIRWGIASIECPGCKEAMTISGYHPQVGEIPDGKAVLRRLEAGDMVQCMCGKCGARLEVRKSLLHLATNLGPNRHERRAIEAKKR